MSIDYQIQKANKLTTSNQNEEAKIIFQSILKKFPQNLRALEGLKKLKIKSLNIPVSSQSHLIELEKHFNQRDYTTVIEKGKLYLKNFKENVHVVQNLLGVSYEINKEFDHALESFQSALYLKPDYYEAYYNLGNLYSTLGKFRNAIENYKQALHFKKDYHQVYNNLGSAYFQINELDLAVSNLNKAINYNPNNINTHNNLGLLLTNFKKFEEAEKHFKKAIELNPNFYQAFNNLGVSQKENKNFDKAMESFDKALEIEPSFAKAHNNIALIHLFRGNIELSIKFFENAVKHNPKLSEAHRNLSTIKKYKNIDKQMESMIDLYFSLDLNNENKMHICFALGKANEDIGEIKKSFEFYEEANKIKNVNSYYDKKEQEKLFIENKSLFLNSNIKPPQDINEKKHIFIVGMPRSGSTLIEQILSNHTLVNGMGESDIIYKCVKKLKSLDKKTLSQESLKSFKINFQTELSNFNLKKTCVTDKSLLNFKWIGYILSSIPNAKIINITRNPNAVCWSIFKHFFNGSEHNYAYCLNNIKSFFQLYLKYMDFWNKKFSKYIYNLSYESLTQNQRTETHKLLTYLELNWEERCFDFHKNSRLVETASAAQIRKKIYTNSSKEWEKFKPHLKDKLNFIF